MQPRDYLTMSDDELLALCVWREARGERDLAKRGVACVVMNRMLNGGFGGPTVHGVVLKPYQFSSFNAPPRTKITDANAFKWPEDNDPAWIDSIDAAVLVLPKPANYDITNGALYYFSPPVKVPPVEWGPVLPTASIDHLSFWRPALPARALAPTEAT